MKLSVHHAWASCRRSALIIAGLAGLVGACNSGDKAAKPSPESSVATTPAESAPEQSTPKTTVAATPKARAVTAEIQEGIEKHIATKSGADDGYFSLAHEDRTLRLRLVRVHIEYLASLGTDENFACVDLVDTDGEVYDVDFFLAGPPGNMVVTDTTVHKINGKPIYAWEQKEDKTWQRVPMDEASAKLQGVIEGEDAFEFRYALTLPTMEKAARIWLPVPITDTHQTVETVSIKAPGTQTMIDDPEHTNKVLMLDLTPEDSGATIDMRFAVKRIEKSSYAEKLESPERYLREDSLIPITKEMRALAKEAIKGKTTDLIRARALYDHVMDRMSYKKVGDEWGKGDATYACDSKTGNCSDYHSYFIAISRASGIPARFAVGAAIPSARDDGGMSGYHCWAEFYADGKWWPIDVSEGDKYSNLSTYYFGHHPANRVELSRGRDLELTPGPVTGPINFLAHPFLEVGGEYVRSKATFTFKR